MHKLNQLIEGGESEALEFKPSLSQKDKIGKAVSGFSNSGGGTVLVGISDGGRVTGLDIGRKTLEDLAEYIKINTDPPIFPSIKQRELNNRKAITITVDESKEKPVFFKDKAYKRVGKSTQRILSSELRRLAKESGGRVYWDEQACKEATLTDIDKEKVGWFLETGREMRGLNIKKKASLKEALMRLELLEDNGLTNAAILLLGKLPQKFFTQSELRCIRFKGTKPVKPFIDMKLFDGTILDQVNSSLSFVLEHIPNKIWLAGKPQREEKYEYPPDAIREAIVNAICHRDYTSQGNIQLRVFDDRIEIWSPGRLPEPLTPDDLRKEHKSIPRNPLIAKQFFWVKYIEKVGTGTNDMINYCREWGIPEPEFKHVTGDFVVVFRRSRLTDEYLSDLGLNERQKNAVGYLNEKNRITNREYQEINKVSKPTATRELKKLVDKEIFIKYGGTGKGTYYVLVERAHKGLTKGSQSYRRSKGT